jgi:S-adenosyl methyltransferase/Protein of unknown function (DUF3375)
VGTESRLQVIVGLLRQIVFGTESDPGERLAELRRQRDALDDFREVEENFRKLDRQLREKIAGWHGRSRAGWFSTSQPKPAPGSSWRSGSAFLWVTTHMRSLSGSRRNQRSCTSTATATSWAARALLTGGSRGTIGYVEADLRQPERIMEQAASTLDLGQPVAILLLRILGHIQDDEEARSIVNRLLARVPRAATW